MRWALWWFALFAAYVIAELTQNGSEIVAGAIIAALSVGITVAAMRNSKPGVRARWSWLRRLSRVPGAMLRDALLVSLRILRSFTGSAELEGYFTRLPFNTADRSDPWTMGREGLAVFGISAAPNSLVADVDLRGELVVHKLFAAEQPAESAEWPL